MKVSLEEREQIRADYLKYRELGMTKEAARRKTAEVHDRGRTTVWDNTYDLELPPVEAPVYKKLETGWPKTYIVTGWEIRVGIDDQFVATLEQMAKEYDAQLVLVPCQASDAQYIPQYIKDKFGIITSDIRFNDNLMLKYVETNALTQSPLAGHQGAYPDTTVIIPGLVKELRTEPSHQYVKQLISTGSIGYLNASIGDYDIDEEDKEFLKKWRGVRTRRHGKGTAIAQNYVQPSAVVIDVLDKKTFLTRFITSVKNGVVYDLNHKFTPNGKEPSQPLALVVGDTHAYSADESAITATKQMIRALSPKEVVLNDFFDGISINHHEIHNAVKFNEVPSLAEEAEVTKNLLAEICNISNKVTYLQSNHDNFLNTWLNSSQNYWRLNRNYAMACGLQFFRTQTGRHPITKLLDFKLFNNLTFVEEQYNHFVGKVLVKHGHEGSNGARTGFLGLAKIYNYYCQGHIHTPSVFRNAVCVGLTAKLEQGYNIGGSGWLHANAVIQPDSSIQLLSIIRGEWKR